MKIYQVILSLLCFAYIYSEINTCEDIRSPSVETCSKGLTQLDISLGFSKCCLTKTKRYKNSEEKIGCTPFSENQFENLEYMIHVGKLNGEIYEASVDCSSVFFKFSFLSLILILL